MRRCLALILLFINITVILAQNWQTQSIDSLIYNDDCSIVIDNQNRPHIVGSGYSLYSDTYKVKYANWNGSMWNFQDIENINSQSGPVFLTTKICLNNYNHPYVAYLMQYPAYHFKIKYAYWDGTLWQKSTIDSFYAGNYYFCLFDNERNLDFTLSRSGIPYICYPVVNLIDSTWDVRCAYKVSDTWSINTIWRQSLSSFSLRTRIAIDTLDNPTIFFNVSDDSSRLFSADFDGNTWTIERILSLWGCTEILPYAVRIDRTNRTHLLYFYDFAVFYALRQNCVWNTEFVGGNGYFRSHGDLALHNDYPYIVYSSTLQPLCFFYKIGSVWNNEIIEPNAPGCFPSLAIDYDGTKHVSYIGTMMSYLCYARRIAPGIEENQQILHTDSTLLKIYPNPVKSMMSIHYSLPIEGKVSLQLYDISGRLVKTLVDEYKNPGNYSLTLNTKTLSSGVYFLSLKSASQRIIERLVIVK